MELSYVDYTDQIGDCIAAHGRGETVFILRKLEKPVRRPDGERANYELEYRWLSTTCAHEKDEAWACVQGGEFTYWTAEELDIDAIKTGEAPLVDVFRLFP